MKCLGFRAPSDRMSDHHLEDGFGRGALTRPYEESVKKHSARALAGLTVDDVGAPLSKFQLIEDSSCLLKTGRVERIFLKARAVALDSFVDAQR